MKNKDQKTISLITWQIYTICKFLNTRQILIKNNATGTPLHKHNYKDEKLPEHQHSASKLYRACNLLILTDSLTMQVHNHAT